MPGKSPESKSNDPKTAVYVIAGKEDSLLSQESEKLLGKLIPEDERMTNLLTIDSADVLPSVVFDELRTAPFLSGNRVVFIKNADKFISTNNNRELLQKYFDNPCFTATLVMAVHSWRSNTKLAKKLPTIGRLIAVSEPKTWELPRRLQEYALEAHNKRLAKEAAEMLVELAGEGLTRLYTEVDKLALYASSENCINIKHVASLVGHNRIFNAFAVIDAILNGNRTGALHRLRNMFAEDKATEYTVVGAFAWHFRRLFNAKSLMERGWRSEQVTKKIGIWNNAKGFLQQLNKMSLKQIGDVLKQLADIDYKTKTGGTTTPVAMEQFIFSLTNQFTY